MGELMFKRTLFACVFAAGAAHAADTPPMLSEMKECPQPPLVGRQEAKVAFTVTEAGAITDMHVVESSGSADADERVMKCVASYSFRPATHDGVAVAAPYHFPYHWGRLQDMEGEQHAYAELERDADHRCHKLYPLDRRFFSETQPISLVVISRQEQGDVQMAISQSAGEKADRNAIRCLQDILKAHDDLPAQFARTISINWSHRR